MSVKNVNNLHISRMSHVLLQTIPDIDQVTFYMDDIITAHYKPVWRTLGFVLKRCSGVKGSILRLILIHPSHHEIARRLTVLLIRRGQGCSHVWALCGGSITLRGSQRVAEHLVLVAEDVAVKVVLPDRLRHEHQRLHEASHLWPIIRQFPCNLEQHKPDGSFKKDF